MEEREKPVSVIVPVYNGAGYIGECLRCIQGQEYEDFRCIVIDDGSTDGTAEAVRRFAEKDGRFRLVTQRNAGPSGARNAGIQAARGRYLAFADADDRPHREWLSHLAAQMDADTDCVICGYQRVTRDGRPVRRFVHSGCEIEGPREWGSFFGGLYRDYLLSSLCNKLYRREAVEEYGLRLDEERKLGEDLLFNLEYLARCGRVRVTEEVLYDYVDRKSGSLTANAGEDRVENAGLLYRAVERFCSRKGIPVPAEVELVYLKSCFTAIEKAMPLGRPGMERVLRQALAAPETEEILRSGQRAGKEAALYKGLFKTGSKTVILPLTRVRSLVKGLLQG